MRIKLKFLLGNNKIPIEYRKAFMHYLKVSLNTLTDVNGYEEFYGDNLKSRELTFAMKFNCPKFVKGCDFIAVDGNVLEVNISTSSIKKAFMLNNAFSKMLNKDIAFGNINTIKLLSINISEGKKVSNNEVFIKMMSPLCIREHIKGKSDYYYSITNVEFTNKTNEIIKEQLKIELCLDDVNFSIEPIEQESKKTVVKHYGQSLESSIGVFKLTGDKKILQYLYDNGVGSRKSAGFGMFQIL